MQMEEDSGHVQALFFTKQERYSIPETPFSIPVTASRDELTSLINQLLEDRGTQASEDEDYPDISTKKKFDFLIDGDIVRGSLEGLISERNLAVENVIRIEYVVRDPPPELTEEFEHDDWVSCVHCNRKFILTGSYDNHVRIWTREGQLACIAKEHSAPVKDVKWIPQTQEEEYLYLSASQDQNICMWSFTPAKRDPQTSQTRLLHRYKGHSKSVEAIAVHPDGSKFCSVSWDTMLKIWSAVPDTNPLDEIENEDEMITKKSKHNDAAYNHATTRTPIITLQGHTQPATAVVWAEHDEIISAGWDHCIRVWDAVSGSNKSTLSGSKVFHDVDWSPLNRLVASASSDKVVRIWDTRQSESSVVQSTLTSHQGWVIAVQWSPQNKHQLLSGSYDSTLKLWDVRSNKVPLFTVAAHEGKVLACDWSVHEVFASGGEDNKLRTFSLLSH